MPTIECNNVFIIISVLFGYILGSIPFGLILTRISGYDDIRKLGSKNIGATNVLRNSNKFLGGMTLLLDGTKGILAILIINSFCHNELLKLYTGMSAILGHIFSCFLRLRGGKGVATSLGVFFIWNWQVSLIACIIWIISYIISRISAVGSLSAFILLPFVSYFITHDAQMVCVMIVISIVVIASHHRNIKKLIK